MSPKEQDRVRRRILALERQIGEPEFRDDSERAERITREHAQLSRRVVAFLRSQPS